MSIASFLQHLTSEMCARLFEETCEDCTIPPNRRYVLANSKPFRIRHAVDISTRTMVLSASCMLCTRMTPELRRQFVELLREPVLMLLLAKNLVRIQAGARWLCAPGSWTRLVKGFRLVQVLARAALGHCLTVSMNMLDHRG